MNKNRREFSVYLMLLVLTGIASVADGQTIDGSVVVEDGRPVSGATVVATRLPQMGDASSLASSSAQTSTKGTFTISNLSAGQYVVCARMMGFDLVDQCIWDVPYHISIPSKQGTSITIVLKRGRIVEFEVDDPLEKLSRSETSAKDAGLLVGVAKAPYVGGPPIYANLVTSDAKKRTYSTVIPFDQDVDTVVLPLGLDVDDGTGKALKAGTPSNRLREPATESKAKKTIHLNLKEAKKTKD